MSKEVGPEKGLGRVLNVEEGEGWEETGWRLGRVSQEHGILVRDESGKEGKLEIGGKIRIVPVSALVVVANSERGRLVTA